MAPSTSLMPFWFVILVTLCCFQQSLGGTNSPDSSNGARRRLLQKADWKTLLNSCSQLTYYAAVHVDKHVSVVAFPEDISTDCPIVAMEHSALSKETGQPLDDGSTKMTKNVHTVELSTGIGRDQLQLLPLGTFSLSKISDAFDRSKVATGLPRESYDLILANCGDFVAQMVTNLGLNWDIKSTEFIAARIHLTYGNIGQEIRQNPNLEKWFTKMGLDPKLIESMSDLELVELLVESKTIHLYEDPIKGYQERRRRMVQIQYERDEEARDEVSRRLNVECGRWYSSECVAETDIRYDREASNVITDQNAAWSKFHGFYEATATAYGSDGRVLEESHIPSGSQFLLPNQMPFSQAPYKMFLNITLSGSRYYEQAYSIYPPASEEFCNQDVPEGMANFIAPGECGWSGTSGYYERFGTSSFEKDGSVTMIPFGYTTSGTPINRKSYASIPAGESNHFGSYEEEGRLVQYTTACLDPDCNQLSTTVDIYDTSDDSEEYTLLGSTRLLANRVGSAQEFATLVRAAYSMNNVPSSQQLEVPMTGACLSGYCPTESDWCKYDPECGVSPYQEPEAYVLAGPVIGFVIAAVVILLAVLYWWSRRLMAEKEAMLRAKFASRIAESIKMQSSASQLTPEKLAEEFAKIDKDKGGTIEKEELWAFVSSGSAGNMSRSDFDLLFSVIDVDNSGAVDFKEFVVFFGKCGEEYNEAAAKVSDNKGTNNKRQSVFEDAAGKLTSKKEEEE